MKKKKLILVNPTLSNPFCTFPPLALGYVAALTPDHWDVEILDENYELATFRECDLVGITGFTAMANRAYQVARMFRDKGVPVVMGGIHASMIPDEAGQFVDSVLIGEAESVWPELITDVEAGNLKRTYTGTHTDLKGLPWPRRDLFDERYWADSIQTSRGCPNDCDFCSVSQFNGYAYRQRPVEDVLEELASLKKKQLFIVDDNIVGLGSKNEERTIALARGMVERQLTKDWYGQAALNVADNEEVLKALRESGCQFLLLGVESDNPEILRAMKKKVNLQRDYQQAFRRIHDAGIGVYGSIIFGTDDDTMETLQRRFDFLLESHMDIIQPCSSTPYPGTRLCNRLLQEGRLLHTNFPADWDRYDLTEVLYKPRNVGLAEYRAIMRRIAIKTYSGGENLRRFLRTWLDTRSLRTAFWCFFCNRVFVAPRDNDGEHAEKFWYLDNCKWPAGTHMNPEMEIHKKRYLSERKNRRLEGAS